MQRLRVDRVDGLPGWYIVPHEPPIGPYATKRMALDAKPGIAAFYRDCERKGWISVEKPRNRRIGCPRNRSNELGGHSIPGLQAEFGWR